MMSNCCYAPPLGEVVDDLGMCSACKEHAVFPQFKGTLWNEGTHGMRPVVHIYGRDFDAIKDDLVVELDKISHRYNEAWAVIEQDGKTLWRSN